MLKFNIVELAFDKMFKSFTLVHLVFKEFLNIEAEIALSFRVKGNFLLL